MKRQSDMEKILTKMVAQANRLDKEIADLKKKKAEDEYEGWTKLNIKEEKFAALVTIIRAPESERIGLAKYYLKNEDVMSGKFKGGRTGRLLHRLADTKESTEKSRFFKGKRSGVKSKTETSHAESNPAKTDPDAVAKFLKRME